MRPLVSVTLGNTREKHKLVFVSSDHPEPGACAAALAESVAGPDWDISYACNTTRRIGSLCESILAENGLQTPSKNTASISELQSQQFDVVVTFCARSVDLCPTFAGLPAHFHWPLDDLVHCENPASRECLERLLGELTVRVKALFEHDALNVVTHLRSNFGSLIDHLTDGVMAHDSERVIFVFNKAAEKITGYSAKEIIGRDCHEVFPGLLCGGHCSFCAGDVAEGKKLRYPSQFVDRKGVLRDLEMSAITIRTPGQESKGTLVIFRDLTEVNRLRRSLQSTKGFHGIVGRHESMKEIFDVIQEIANENVPVLIEGESGTGKELIAEALHKLSSRRQNPFVPVNCGALPEGILESELFGHVKGAFTGAVSSKRGRFELADKGTLFLDEIGEISQALQVKLLRVLEEKSFIPVGGERAVKTDVRIVCATNRDLREMTERGEFRDDLYYRLAVYPIQVPPLRERQSDIGLLIDHSLQNLAVETGRKCRGITPEASKVLEEYFWPGNVRQLFNAMHFALIKCQGGVIRPEHLPLELRESAGRDGHVRAGRPQKLSREVVLAALNEFGGNRAKAARALGVARSTLYRYLQ